MRKVLLIGGIASAALLAGAFAQSHAQGPGGFGPPGEGSGGMGMHGMGMHGAMGMHRRMGAGTRGPMGMGMPGMMNHGSATASEHDDILALFFSHDRIRRTVTNLADGIRTVTESDDPKVAAAIKTHVADMGRRVEQGRDPGLPIETPALHAIFRNKDKIKSAYEVTDKGVVVVQTSTDRETVAVLQQHAAEVTGLVKGGMAAAHSAMMQNRGMMRGGMHGPMMHGPMMHGGPDGDAPPNRR
jgi:hypothetical protein